MLFGFAKGAAAFIAAAYLSATFSSAPAAEIPAKYRGVYVIGNGDDTEGCELPNSESDIGEFPWLLVTKDKIHAHETVCSITTVRPNVKRNADELTFACFGEGDEKPSTTKEIWSMELETKSIWGFKISQPYLSKGESRFKKCALQGTPPGN